MSGVTGVVVFAHQGGWDETLFVLAPLLLFAFLLVVARRRVDRMEADDTGDELPDEDPTTDSA